MISQTAGMPKQLHKWLTNDLQRWVWDPEVVWLDVTLKSVQFLMQDIETEKAHFGDRNLLLAIVAHGVSMAVHALLVALRRRVPVLMRI